MPGHHRQGPEAGGQAIPEVELVLVSAPDAAQRLRRALDLIWRSSHVSPSSPRSEQGEDGSPTDETRGFMEPREAMGGSSGDADPPA